MAVKEELLNSLKDGVVNYKSEQVINAAKQILNEGYDPLEAVMDGLAAGGS